MNISFADVVKCVARKGRRALVRRILETELSRDAILRYAADAVVYGVNHGVNAVPSGRRPALHSALERSHSACGRLLAYTSPGSEGGEIITPAETERLTADIGALTEQVFTGTVVSALHDLIVEKVP